VWISGRLLGEVADPLAREADGVLDLPGLALHPEELR
jgi:hypothetical protein